MIIDPYRFGFVGPLDNYQSGLWSALSISCLLTAWINSRTLEVRRSSDNALSDIGFLANGVLDTAALATFLGSSDGFVRTFTNQQGTSNNGFDQTAANADQPKIATAGSSLGFVQFDGTSDYLRSGVASSGVNPAFMVFLRGKLRSTGTQVVLENSTNYNSSNAAVAYYDVGALSLGIHATSPTGYSRSDFSGAFPNDTTQCYRYDRAASGGANQAVLFINGVKQTRTGNGDIPTQPSGNFNGNVWYLGARGTPTLFSPLNLHTLLVYESALSDADCATISNILAAL